MISCPSFPRKRAPPTMAPLHPCHDSYASVTAQAPVECSAHLKFSTSQTVHHSRTRTCMLCGPFSWLLPDAMDRAPPKIISDNVNHELASIPTAKGLQVIGSHWNNSGNCILTFLLHTALSMMPLGPRSFFQVSLHRCFEMTRFSPMKPSLKPYSATRLYLDSPLHRTPDGCAHLSSLKVSSHPLHSCSKTQIDQTLSLLKANC